LHNAFNSVREEMRIAGQKVMGPYRENCGKNGDILFVPYQKPRLFQHVTVACSGDNDDIAQCLFGFSEGYFKGPFFEILEFLSYLRNSSTASSHVMRSSSTISKMLASFPSKKMPDNRMLVSIKTLYFIRASFPTLSIPRFPLLPLSSSAISGMICSFWHRPF